ncbi:LPP20 family lipoprotein [Sulfurimonas sp.]|nr:LPP20 family lipoprotein [Sulfurimonas sp.]
MKSFLISLVVVTCSFASPSWYYKIPKNNSSVYIGYASATSEAKAKQEALSDIVSQISVNVSTSMDLNQQVVNGESVNVEEFKSHQDSSASLSDYKLLKSEFDDGKYYVAIAYENIPSFDKFVKKLVAYEIKKDEKQNSYTSQTLMAKKLNSSLAKKIDFSLLRKDKKWFIKYKKTLQALDKKDFARFFVSKSSKNISINTNKKNNILYEGDMFYFKVKSSKKGFVTIFSVYEDGTVSTLVRNIHVNAKKVQNIPDKDYETVAQAGLMQEGKETYDLYVALYSSKRLHFDSFAHADEELISEEKYKNFDELIEFVNNKEYATLKVVTKPRK